MERLQNRVCLVTGGNSGIATAVETTCVGTIRSFEPTTGKGAPELAGPEWPLFL